ncbi:Putative ribonuclease H protein At1g65750 [Linum perenne]
MASFLIPKENIKKLNQIIGDFWWGKVEDKKKMHWVSWDKLCLPKEEGGLGFKDLETFNHALLAKQTWRILHNPQLLIAKIYEAKYYPNSSLLNAGKGSNPSWGWRGILKGRDIINIGHRWQIGNRMHINTFSDHWIPSRPPSSPVMELKDSICDIPFSVAGLISNGSWDENKIRSLFKNDSVIQILSIPIPRRQVMDKIIWQYTASGEYSVQSGYEVAKEIKMSPPQLEPTDVVDARVWKDLWKLAIQPKFHLFLWRILKRSLPVKTELNYRGMEIPTFCPVCWDGEETIEHLFFDCILAIKVARLCNLPINMYKGPSFVYSCREIVKEPMDVRVSFIIFWWRVWKSRKLVVFRSVQDFPEKITDQFFFQPQEQLDNFPHNKKTQVDKSINIRKTNVSLCKGTMSVNTVWVQVDGATSQNLGGAVGFIIRSLNGLHIFSGGRCFKRITDPFTIECLAIREAIFWCLETNLKSIVLEGDAEQVKNKVAQGKVLHSSAGAIIHEIRQLINELVFIDYNTILRAQNSTAHGLAKGALAFLPFSSGLLNLRPFG